MGKQNALKIVFESYARDNSPFLELLELEIMKQSEGVSRQQQDKLVRVGKNYAAMHFTLYEQPPHLEDDQVKEVIDFLRNKSWGMEVSPWHGILYRESYADDVLDMIDNALTGAPS